MLISVNLPLNYFTRHSCRIVAVLLSTWLTIPVSQAEIRRIVHPDGRVEYTNQAPSTAPSGDKIYKYRNAQGRLSFSDTQPGFATEFEVLRFDCYACRAGSNVDWQRTPLNLESYRDYTRAAAEETGLDESLIRAVIHAESAFNAQAVSVKGARGLMQLMPQTAAYLGVADSFDAAQNIRGGSRYLQEMLSLFEEDERLATAAYNAGPGSVSRYQGIPPFQETRNYVERVQILKSRYATALGSIR